jgi:hypothetical protein
LLLLLKYNSINWGNVMKLQFTLAIAALLAAGVASAAPLANGNFETGTLGPWVTTGNVALATGNGVDFYFGAGSAAQLGNYAIAFNAGDTAPNGSVSQSFSTVLGNAYMVSFNYGPTSNGSQSIVSSILGADGSTALASITATDSNPNAALADFSYVFIADGNIATVKFSDIASNQTRSLDGVLDNVSITSAVPEPATLGLLGLGLLGLGASRRKRTV